MLTKIKNFWNGLKFTLTLLIVELVLWFICKLAIWIEVVFHPYTYFGYHLLVIGEHFLFLLLGLWIAAYVPLFMKRRQK